jgi:hypothetical protein
VSRRLPAVATALSLLAAACYAPAPAVDHERIVTDPARGVRFVIPPGWREKDAEIRSPAGSLLTLRVFDLVEADKRFVAGLPDTLLPQLREWAELYYIVEGEPTRRATTVDGVAATELVYPIRVRKKDPPSRVVYWVVIRKTRLFVFRAAFPADALATDEPVLRAIVDRWSFVDPAE